MKRVRELEGVLVADWHQVDGWRWEAVLEHGGIKMVLQVTPMRGEKDSTTWRAECFGPGNIGAAEQSLHLTGAKQAAQVMGLRVAAGRIRTLFQLDETRRWERSGGRERARAAQLAEWTSPF